MDFVENSISLVEVTPIPVDVPDNSKFTPAIRLVDGELVYDFRAGDVIIMERYTELLKNPDGSPRFLDSAKYNVLSVDHLSGQVVLLSQDGSGSKILTNPRNTYFRYKYYLPKVLKTSSPRVTKAKKEPGMIRPQKVKVPKVPKEPKVAKSKSPVEKVVSNTVPRKRGRPQGSKNKPKVVQVVKRRGRPPGSKNRVKA
jgi:hypothetical protein